MHRPTKARRYSESIRMAIEIALFFFQAEDGIRDLTVTGVQTCALPIWKGGAEETKRLLAWDGHAWRRLAESEKLTLLSGFLGERRPEFPFAPSVYKARLRSEERRVGKEGRFRWSPYH